MSRLPKKVERAGTALVVAMLAMSCSNGATKAEGDVGVASDADAGFEPDYFNEHLTFTLGLEPQPPVVGDFNGDGRLDIAVINQFSADASFLLFGSEGEITETGDTLVRGVAAVAADFDGDGRDDLAISVEGEPRIEVVLDPTATSFRLSLGLSDLPDGLATADFDGDGDIDLAASISGNGSTPASSVAMLPWGDATFGPARTTSVGLQPRSLLARGSDLVVLLGTTSAMVLQNDGTGGFAASAPFGVGGGVLYATLVDIDRSGALDLVAADLTANLLTAAIDVPSGDAAALTEVSTPFGIATANINEDGVPDLVVTSIDEERVVALISRSDGTYRVTSVAHLPGAVRLGGIVAADFDGDQVDDLAVVERGRDTPGTLHVLLAAPIRER